MFKAVIFVIGNYISSLRGSHLNFVCNVDSIDIRKFVLHSHDFKWRTTWNRCSFLTMFFPSHKITDKYVVCIVFSENYNLSQDFRIWYCKLRVIDYNFASFCSLNILNLKAKASEDIFQKELLVNVKTTTWLTRWPYQMLVANLDQTLRILLRPRKSNFETKISCQLWKKEFIISMDFNMEHFTHILHIKIRVGRKIGWQN